MSEKRPSTRSKAKVIRAQGLSEYEGIPIVEPRIPKAIKGYRTRIVLVNGEFWCRIPEFITRENRNLSKKRGYGCWKVKRSYSKDFPYKAFADSKYGIGKLKRSPLASLKAAMDYLSVQSPYVESEYRVSDDVDLNPDRYYEEGAHKLIEVQPKGTIFKAYYYNITGVPHHGPLRLYIGSTRTITQARIDEKVRMAKRIRKKLMNFSKSGYTGKATRDLYELARTDKVDMTYEGFLLQLKIPKS